MFDVDSNISIPGLGILSAFKTDSGVEFEDQIRFCYLKIAEIA